MHLQKYQKKVIKTFPLNRQFEPKYKEKVPGYFWKKNSKPEKNRKKKQVKES